MESGFIAGRKFGEGSLVGRNWIERFSTGDGDGDGDIYIPAQIPVPA